MPSNYFRRSAGLKKRVNKNHSIYIDSAASSGGQGKLAFLGLCLRQHCQFLNFGFKKKNFFSKVFNENKGDYHQRRIIILLKMSVWKRSVRWCSSDAGKEPYRNKVVVISLLQQLNHLNTKGRLLYLKTQFVPRSKHFSSRL